MPPPAGAEVIVTGAPAHTVAAVAVIAGSEKGDTLTVAVAVDVQPARLVAVTEKVVVEGIFVAFTDIPAVLERYGEADHA